jgi:hypothetical protein
MEWPSFNGVSLKKLPLLSFLSQNYSRRLKYLSGQLNVKPLWKRVKIGASSSHSNQSN